MSASVPMLSATGWQRFAQWLALLTCLVAVNGTATERAGGAIAPPPIVQKTVDGATMRILHVGWLTHDQVFGPDHSWQPPAGPGLTVEYYFHAGWFTTMRVSLQDTSGRKLGIGLENNGIPRFDKKDNTETCVAWWGGISRTARVVNLHFEWLSKAAEGHPDGADWQASDVLTFTGIPFPPPSGGSIMIPRYQTTKHGTEVALSRVTRVPSGSGPLFLRFYGSSKLSARSPADSSVVTAPKVIDSTGAALEVGTFFTDGCNSVHRWGGFWFEPWEEPSPNARSLTIKIKVLETIPSLCPSKWRRQADIPLRLREWSS